MHLGVRLSALATAEALKPVSVLSELSAFPENSRNEPSVTRRASTRSVFI